MEKRKNLLIAYALIIFIALITIMFIIPDSFFLGKYDTNIIEPKKDSGPKEFVDYETQKSNLMKNNFEYEYLILDSMRSKTYQYDCSGKINETIESGTCTSPEKFSYTEANKKESFSKINIDYLDPTYIFNLIKDITPEETKYPTLREYKYVTTIEDLETDIIVHTDLNEITKIEISNMYMQYIIKYNNVNIDN